MRAAIVVLLSCSAVPVFVRAQAPAQPQPSQVVTGTTAEEVLVDLVVRDRRGRPVKDLEEAEIEVLEDGVPQKIASFRLVDVGAAEGAGKPAEGAARPPNIVTLIFERLGNEERRLARQAALRFVETETNPNTYIGVFSIDMRLFARQLFTKDREAVKQAIERVTSGQYSQKVPENEAIRAQLAAGQQAAEPGATSVEIQIQAAARGILAAADSMMGSQTNLSSTGSLITGARNEADELMRQQLSTASIFALMSLINGERLLPGRKTVLYFSQGLYVPSNLTEHFHTLIGAANRAEVTFYSIHASGLGAGRIQSDTQSMLEEASKASMASQASRGAVTSDQAKLFDKSQESIRADTRGNLGELADDTGGFLISDTNDFRGPVRRIAEDIQSYYALSYRPASANYDGRFRKITVRAKRADLKIQTRSGYFALPPALAGGASTVLPFEAPLLAALNEPSLKTELEYRDAAMEFGPGDGGRQCVIGLELPMNNVAFETDASTKQYKSHVSVVALVKGADGSVVRKFSQDLPLQGPVDRLDAVKKGNFIYTRFATLPPGKYTVETAVYDWTKPAVSGRRTALEVSPAGQGVRISSLVQIRRVDNVDPANKNLDDPLQFEGGKVVPSLGDPVQKGPGVSFSYYFVIYPAAGAEKPQLTMEFRSGGNLLGAVPVELPAPDPDGRIRYIATIPIDPFPAGEYEVKAVVKQGASSDDAKAMLVITQ